MTVKPSDLERIEHILESIYKIYAYTDDIGFVEFSKTPLIQDAVIKNYEIIGEAAYHISAELKEKYENIDWKNMQGLRHVLVHDYYKINPEILWNTKEQELHTLLLDLEDLLKSETKNF